MTELVKRRFAEPRPGGYLASMKAEMKVVGKRKPVRAGLDAADNLLKAVVELRKGKPFIPKGVYRFRSHEEKDQWTLKMLAR